MNVTVATGNEEAAAGEHSASPEQSPCAMEESPVPVKDHEEGVDMETAVEANPPRVEDEPMGDATVDVTPDRPRLPAIPALLKVKDEVALRVPSNIDNPITIDSDEEDRMWKEVVQNNPSDDDSDISLGTEDVVEGVEGSEPKVSSKTQIRIQLQSIGKKKLSVNKANVHKSRDLEMQNLLLQRELEKERKLREQAHETLRNAGLAELLSSGQCPSSPTAPVTQQATTSIASAPELSGSVADAAAALEECIPSTQVCQKPYHDAPMSCEQEVGSAMLEYELICLGCAGIWIGGEAWSNHQRYYCEGEFTITKPHVLLFVERTLLSRSVNSVVGLSDRIKGKGGVCLQGKWIGRVHMKNIRT